jgi:hypothetical protein
MEVAFIIRLPSGLMVSLSCIRQRFGFWDGSRRLQQSGTIHHLSERECNGSGYDLSARDVEQKQAMTAIG